MGPGYEHSSRWAAEQAKLALAAIRWNWDTAYAIELRDDGTWVADRLDGLGATIEATGPEELRKLILDDYMLKPVPRDLPGRMPGE